MDLRKMNETQIPFWECSRTPDNSSVNSPALEVNATCSNASIIQKFKPTRPKEMDSVRIILYSLVFLLSVFGNLLIIVVLIANKRMRTVTNSFLLSLAVSDLMMAIFCMPFNLIPSLLEDFIFGAAMCKTVAYFMGISVSISTFSLVAIAIERYSAICNPLKSRAWQTRSHAYKVIAATWTWVISVSISVSISTFSLVAIAIERYSAICNPLKSRAWQTRSHAYKVIAATWVLSVGIMVPYPVFSILVPFNKPNNITAHMCRLDWPISQVEQTWYVLLLFILFFIPGVVMIIAYGLISRELYRGIQFELEQKKDSRGVKNGLNGALSSGHDESDGCYIQVPKKPPAMELSALTTSGTVKADRPRSNTSEAKLIAKKRVIRMLIIIVAMFFICWMPLYSANTWKAFDQKSAQRALSGAPISFIQLLSYTSACVNPIIYCFMNTRFRKALLVTFGCCRSPCHKQRKRREGDDEITGVTGASITKFSYTTVSTVGPC
ncbi:cholecystokinin receptor-like [Sinocyclocheilus grahami]|uniref:cholecystokinin receptor-like n=1 Tax=Sinocyclocheilus grahami TaxID=75366 RepID=UPI0007ACC2B0|nr:PREDICTED: cholecystokinin receptor-like [Sinocyclocheilus grahami]